MDQTFGFGDVSEGGLPHGQYDRDSIMNYCRSILALHEGMPIGLSSGDIAAIKSIYSGKPKFPREEACRKDGHSWVAGTDSSCCRVPKNTKSSGEPTYPICQDKDSQSDPDITYSPERLNLGATIEAKVNPPVNTGVAILSCYEGQYPFRVGVDQKMPGIFNFKLLRAATLQGNTFTCTHIDAYERNGADLGMQNSKKMARHTFTTPINIYPSPAAIPLNLESAQWQTFNVVNGVTTAPNIPVPQKTNVDPITKAPQEALQKQKIVVIEIENVPMTSQVFSASMNCNIGSVAASSQMTKTKTKEGKSSFGLLFLFPVPPQRGNVQCTDLQWMTKAQNIQGTNDAKKMYVKFQQSLAFALDDTTVNKSFTAPSCGDPSPTSDGTTGMKTGVGAQSNPQTNRAPSPAASQPGPAGMISSGTQAAAPAARPALPAAPSPQPTNGCNYDKAAQNNGWGWNPVTKISCPPLGK
jgi:hypothetical protein